MAAVRALGEIRATLGRLYSAKEIGPGCSSAIQLAVECVDRQADPSTLLSRLPEDPDPLSLPASPICLGCPRPALPGLLSVPESGLQDPLFHSSPQLYARYSTEVKRRAFQLLFHVRGSYRRVSDFVEELGISVHYGTLLRWVKKAGEEYIDMLRLQGRIVAATVIIDEKWVKIRDRWHYVFIATDATADDLLHLDLFKRNDKQAIKGFLLTLKALGIYPKVIVTDLLKGYASVIKEVFPEAYHHECILHAKRAARRIVYEYFPGEENKNIRKKLIKKLRWFFESESPKEVTSRFEKIQSLKTQYGEPVRPMIEMLAGYLPKFQEMLERPEIPKTSNTAERVIKELDSKYQNMCGFSSFHVASFMLKVFLVYYRSKKFASGRYQGKSPLEIKGLKLQFLSWTDYLFGHFFSELCQAGEP